MQINPYLNFHGNAKEADRLLWELSVKATVEKPWNDIFWKCYLWINVVFNGLI